MNSIKAQSQKMPGPGLLRSIQFAHNSKKNYITSLEKAFKEYGDFVQFSGNVPVAMLFHPDAVEHLLKKNAKNYIKSKPLDHLKPVLGNGLLTLEGEEWHKHRRLIGPEFQMKKVQSYFDSMTRHLQTLIETWKVIDQPIDIAKALSQTTYAIAGESFFGAQLEDSSDVVYQGIELTSEVAVKRMAVPLNFPLNWPFPSHLRFKNAIKEMNKIVFEIIDQRFNSIQKDPEKSSADILSRLMQMNATGEGEFSRQQIRDEVMTLLLAGHETTANSLSWTLYLLGKYPSIQENVRDEVQNVVTGFIPKWEECSKLTFTKMTLEESMRLYPPVALIGRESLEEDEIHNFKIPKGCALNLSQWITHRHPDFWIEPNEFKPERFAKPNPGGHAFAYFPFAAGPRECVGKNMAMIEAICILAGLIKNFRFELTGPEVTIKPLITLRPHPGVHMKLERLS